MSGNGYLPDSIAFFRFSALGFYSALILFFFISTPLMLGNLSLGAVTISFLQTIPLLIFAPGLLQTRIRTYAWMSFVVLLYFVHAVLVAFRPEQLIQGLIEVSLCVGLFVSLLIFIRRYREYYGAPL